MELLESKTQNCIYVVDFNYSYFVSAQGGRAITHTECRLCFSRNAGGISLICPLAYHKPRSGCALLGKAVSGMQLRPRGIRVTARQANGGNLISYKPCRSITASDHASFAISLRLAWRMLGSKTHAHTQIGMHAHTLWQCKLCLFREPGEKEIWS